MRWFIVGGLLVALALAGLASPFASPEPDGLERVAADHGFEENAEEHALAEGPLADYSVRGVPGERTSTGLAGVIGVLLTFGVGMLVFGGLRLRRPAPD